MVRTITSHGLAILWCLGSFCFSIASAEEIVGNIMVDENGIRLQGISVHTSIDEGENKSNVSQSISIGNIVNSSNNGVSSIQIGTVSENKETSCEHLENMDSQSYATKIVANGRDICLDNRVSPSVCIKGSSNTIVVIQNARVSTLYLHGSGNEIHITDAASIERIDIVGQGNTLSLPKKHDIVIKGLVGSNKVNVQ